MRLAIVSLAFLMSCDAPPGDGGASPRDAGADLATVRGLVERAQTLKKRHRGVEAIEVLQPLFDKGELRGRLADTQLATRARSLYAGLLLDLSRVDEALPILQSLARERGADSQLALALARAYRERGDAEAALEVFERLPPRLKLANAVEHGRILLAGRRFERAIPVLAAALIRDPWATEPYLYLGRALARSGSGELAEVFLARYRESEAYRRAAQRALEFEQVGDVAAAWHARGEAEIGRGNLYEAMLAFNRALRANQALGAAYVELARLSLFLERPGDALAVLERLPDDPRVDGLRARAREALRDSQATGTADPVAALRNEVCRQMKSLPLTEGVASLARLAVGLWELGQRDDARAIAHFLAGLRPRDPRVTEVILLTCRDRADLFHRLRALSFREDPESRARFERELADLGVSPEELGQ